jgi:hypothetical protein
MTASNYEPFTIEELFAIPNIEAKTISLPPEIHTRNVTVTLPATIKVSAPKNTFSTKKYGYFIIPVVLVTLGVCIYYYIEYQQKRKDAEFKLG